MLLLLTIFLGLSSANAQILNESLCETRRQATLDMGSTTTKLAIANVRTCGSKRSVIGPIEKRDFAFDFNARKGRGQPPTLASEDRAEYLRLFRAATKGLNPNDFHACVATGGLRHFSNPGDFLAGLPVQCQVIDPLTEGKIGYHGIKNSEQSGCASGQKYMWDIGGASTQIFGELKNGEQGNLAELNIGSDKVREVLAKATLNERKCTHPDQKFKKEDSPNPIGDIDAAIKSVQTLINKQTELSSQLANACLVGIGMAHRYAIHDQMRYLWPEMTKHASGACRAIRNQRFNPKSYTAGSLRCMADFLSQFSDCALADLYKMLPQAQGSKGPNPQFSITNVSTLVFVLGILGQEFPTEKPIVVENISLAEPLLTFPTQLLPAKAPLATPAATDALN